MQVLSVASEIYPLIKTGGLADVAGALPPAFAGHGVDVRSLLPGYPKVMAQIEDGETVAEYAGLGGVPFRLVAARAAGLDLVVLDAPALFDRAGGPYSDAGGSDYADNWLRFAAFSRAACDIAGGAVPGFQPDLVHAHDWQAAMAPAYLRYRGVAVPSVLTIHNLAFQGQFAASIFGGLELPPHAFALDGVEYYGGVGFLKAGLQSASAITTVSPTYASEIATPAFGMGLDGLINTRAADLHGIVNGIDTATWDPETDPLLPSNYSARRPKGRAANRAALEQRFGLDTDAAPIFAVVSRLTWQKGMDLLAEAAGALVHAGGKLAVLGSGEPGLEAQFLSLAGQHAGRIGVVIGYDEPLAHAMQGGADAILIPSRFEPCGLTQLCGLRYGSVPVVARTGGLADTVIDANIAAVSAGVATGVQFATDSVASLVAAVERTVELHAQPKLWSTMQKQGMKADVSWAHSARAYADLYASLVPEQGTP